jgi:hypothetical protein
MPRRCWWVAVAVVGKRRITTRRVLIDTRRRCNGVRAEERDAIYLLCVCFRGTLCFTTVQTGQVQSPYTRQFKIPPQPTKQATELQNRSLSRCPSVCGLIVLLPNVSRSPGPQGKRARALVGRRAFRRPSCGRSWPPPPEVLGRMTMAKRSSHTSDLCHSGCTQERVAF